MGAFCSKSSAYSGGHTVLGSASDNTNSSAPSRPDPRSAAAEAAERRLKAVSSPSDFMFFSFLESHIQAQARGTNASNPNKGRLAQQVARQTSKPAPEQQQEERLVWD
ncbi:hypothetical protein BDQ12DRAFT_720846 [Crucibulum laeve]|uniref:Uncharacterized protein n=1 Tax=Crucibulum laeve TaxID=68775 RepID=A0A5C3M753_9AGAR|nr:hypothetical protein BDQ12DRAFT_720846 [Crucibulum laeve]